MEDSEYIIIRGDSYFRVSPEIISYDKKSKRVKTTDNSSRIKRFISSKYKMGDKDKSIIFELNNVRIFKLNPVSEEDGYVDIILGEENGDAISFFAKMDQYNVEMANKNLEEWFKGGDLESITINYLEEIYKPCLRVSSSGRIILRCSVFLREYLPDFDIIGNGDEYLEFKDIVDKRVKVIFENKGLIFSSKSFHPLFYVNTVKLEEEEILEKNEDDEDEISFSRNNIPKEKFLFNDEISLGNYRNNNENVDEKVIKKEDNFDEKSVDSQIEDFLVTLEKESNLEKEKWLKEVESEKVVNRNLREDLMMIGSDDLKNEVKKKENRTKRMKIVKRRKEKNMGEEK